MKNYHEGKLGERDHLADEIILDPTMLRTHASFGFALS